MDKEKALENFLKSLKIALNHASVYFKDHPRFVKSVDDLQQKLKGIFSWQDPLLIGVTPLSLLIDGRELGRIRLYQELARHCHRRKIKSIELKGSVTAEELSCLLCALTLAPDDLAQAGGLSQVLKREGLSGVEVRALDYFEFLKGKGEAIDGDLWSYLLGRSQDEPDSATIVELADDFERTIGKLRGKDFLADEKLWKNILVFLNHFKAKDNERFRRCAKEVAKAILRDKDVVETKRLAKLKSFFQDLEATDLSAALWEEMISDEHFDVLTFKLFAQLIDGDKHNSVASSLADKIEQEKRLENNPQLASRVKELFSLSVDPHISRIYQKTLASFLQEPSADEGCVFNRGQLFLNYRYILLNLFLRESRPAWLKLLLANIGKQEGGGKILDDDYLKLLLPGLAAKIRADPSLAYILEEIATPILAPLEQKILHGEFVPYLDSFLGLAAESRLGRQAYLEMILKGDQLNASTLKLFFKFFSDNLDAFVQELQRRGGDVSFISGLIHTLSEVDSPLSLRVLKDIFHFSNNLMKVEVLRAMQALYAHSLFDLEFLLHQLREGDLFLRREALLILSKDKRYAPKALDALFSVPNPFGIKNRVLRENIELVAEIELKEAAGWLTNLTKHKSLWTRGLAKKARVVLAKWQAA